MAAFINPGRLFLLLLTLPVFAAGKLSAHFYKHSCPSAEAVVRRTVEEHYLRDRAVAAGLLRLHFHDCFVRGCDASILLDETPSGTPVEKSSPANIGLKGEDVIDASKLQLESICPETVSCADIIAFAARDAAVIAGIPPYPVTSGRRDGVDSCADDSRRNLPAPFFNAERQIKSFRKKGLSAEEMVVLLGSHAIGGAHCSSFDYRIHNFTASRSKDTSMNLGYAQSLKLKCPAIRYFNRTNFSGAPNNKVEFGVNPSLKLDGSYYSWLIRGLGLLESDQALMKYKRTRRMVRRMAKHPRRWSKKFAAAMIKLGKLGVITGDEGEVRLNCRLGN